MPELIKVKMNGVIPSVPITTLAGIASLTDLLPEMPLPTPLPQALTNKSLLFHARVAEEAKLQLSNRDETLVPQLIQALSQTSSDNIELKDQSVLQSEQPYSDPEQHTPELLKAILEINPHVFKGPQYNSRRTWPCQNTQLMSANQSPAHYGRFSPSYSNSSGSRQTPQGSPAQPASARTVLPPPQLTTSTTTTTTTGNIMSHAQHPRMPVTPQNHTDVSQMSPFAVPSPSPRATVITEQTRTSTTPQHHIQDDPNGLTNQLSNINNPHVNIYSPAHMGSPSTATTIMQQQQQQQQQQQMNTHVVQPHHHNLASLTPQHSIHMTSPMHSSIPNQPMNMNVNLQQAIYDPIINHQLQHPINVNHTMDIANVVQDNSQFLLDSVTGLPDIDLPIESIDPKPPIQQSVDNLINQQQQQQQQTVYPNLNPESVASAFDSALTMPIHHLHHHEQHPQQQQQQQQQLPPPLQQQQQQQHHLHHHHHQHQQHQQQQSQSHHPQQIQQPHLHDQYQHQQDQFQQQQQLLQQQQLQQQQQQQQQLILQQQQQQQLLLQQQQQQQLQDQLQEQQKHQQQQQQQQLQQQQPQSAFNLQLPTQTPEHHHDQINEHVIKDVKLMGQPFDTKFKEPVVMLNRLSLADQALMQQKSPNRIAKLGLKNNNNNNNTNTNNNNNNNPNNMKSDSDNDEDIGENNKLLKSSTSSSSSSSRSKERSLRARRRKRIIDDSDDNDDGDNADDDEDKKEPTLISPIKPKIRKIERKLVPVLAKLSVDELMETNTYQLFNSMIDTIFENTEDVVTMGEIEEDGDVPAEILIQKYELQALCKEAAKLKSLRAMESIPADRLVRLLNILEKNIRDGARVSPLADPDDDIEESKLWMQMAMERVLRAVDASVIALNIMTSQNMPKTVYLEDVIDRIVLFMKFQLQNTIYPSFDPVYRIDSKNKTDNLNSGRKKRGHMKEVREKSILEVYNKMRELVSLLAELLNIQVLTDTSVLHASTLGVAPFFVESVNDLQLSALKLVTVIFTKYEKHRRLLLDDILASIARLPSSKRSLRTYKLHSGDYIQMLTALVLQLIQCVVILPDNLIRQDNNNKTTTTVNSTANNDAADNQDKNTGNNKNLSHIDADVLVINKYETATRLGCNFLSVFLNKCSSKGTDIDYRPLFENFIQDLLATVNKPEWPAAELLLSILGTLLVGHFSNKTSDMSLRVASIEYLGVVAARLRKDAVNSQCKLSTIDQIIIDIKAEQQKDSDYDMTTTSTAIAAAKDIDNNKRKVNNKINEDEERTKFLQKVLLDHLAVNGTNDPSLIYARHFYLAQWYRDCAHEKTRVGQKSSNNKNITPIKKSSQNKKRNKSSSSNQKRNKNIESDKSDDSDDSDIEELDFDDNDNNEKKNSELYRIIEEKKKFILSSIRPCSSSTKPDILQTYIDYNSAELISQYLASKRPFSQSFDIYLKQILHVLTESSIAIRTKAMKCLTTIVEADPSVLGRSDMQLGVRHSFLDHSTSVREAAVDLVGKFVLSRPELIDKYYDMLLARILDTGVSVRKRVIKILKDICVECPDYSKIPEICGKMIRRVNDEEGIRRLVMEVFQNMWFTPIKETQINQILDSTILLRKVMNITDVVAKNKDIGLEWFEQLLVSLFKPKEDKEDSTKLQTEPPKGLLTACQQIVDCLIQNILKLESMNNTTTKTLNNDDSGSNNYENDDKQRLVACMKTLYLFAKIRPQLLVEHASTLQPYLGLKCQTQGDYHMISCVAHTLELVVPLMQHPSETFLAQLEEDSIKLILQHDKSVVASCLSCLGSIVNNVTKNYSLIRDCFNKYYCYLTKYKMEHEKDPNSKILLNGRPLFRRALFTVGLLLRYFDFTDPQVTYGLIDNIKDHVFQVMSYFVNQDDNDIRHYTLTAIGSICIRHSEFMLTPELKKLYHYLLTSDSALEFMKIQVLNNIEVYLQEEEKRMIKQDQEWSKMCKQENLKEMGDVSSGMASTVIQLYLKEILESFINTNIRVRQSACKVIQLILAQGLVYPIQIVPYLICMSTDIEVMVSHSADNQLQEIERKYPGFIHMQSQYGIKLSYRLQKILQNNITVRGMRLKDGEFPSALNGFLYTILRNTKQQRRAIAISFLKQFEESAKSSLSQMLYLADNLAYFTYQVQDEPLFIIHHIDIIISMSGDNLLQSFKEALLPKTFNQINTCNDKQQQQQLTTTTTTATSISSPFTSVFNQSIIYGSDGQPRPVHILSAIEDEDDDEEDDESIVARLPQDTTLLREYITASQGFLLLLTLRQHLKEIYGFSDAKISQYSPSESAKVYEKAVTRKSTAHFNPKATLAKLQENVSDKELDDDGRKKLAAEYLDFKQLMIKFDPKEPDDEAAAAAAANANTTTTTTTIPGNNTDVGVVSHSTTDDSVQRILNPEINQNFVPMLNTGTGDFNTSHHQQQQQQQQQQQNSIHHHNNTLNSMTPTAPSPRVPKLTIHAHPETNKEHRKHRTHKIEKVKKHKKKKRRRISDSSDSGDDCSDPDFMV